MIPEGLRVPVSASRSEWPSAYAKRPPRHRLAWAAVGFLLLVCVLTALA